MNYETTAKQIIQCLGKDNIKSVAHCMTRLRFILHNDQNVNDNNVKKIPGVMGIMKKGGQYQIIIGNEVEKCFKEVQSIGGFSGTYEQTNHQVETKKKGMKYVIDCIFDYISGSMSAIIPALIGGGMIKVLLIILPMLNILSKDSSTYAFLTFFGDAPFYFMPIMLAYTASQKMHITPMLAVSVAGIMLHPNFTTMVATNDPMSLFGLPVTGVNYSSTVIPILIMVWIMKYIEGLFQKIIPTMLKSFLTPLFVIIISGIIALVIVGPLGSIAGNALYAGAVWVQQYAGWLAMAILAAFMPFIVMTGMHWALAVFALVASQQTPDTLLLPVMMVSNIAQGVACVVVGLKARNKDTKSTAFSSGILALLAGVTEPAMYGITLKLKKPMIATMISGAIAGLLVGLFQLKAYTFSVPSLISLPQFISEAGGNNFIYALIIAGVTIAVTAITTWFIGFQEEDLEIEETKMDEIEGGSHDPKKILSPLTGTLLSLQEVNDVAFSEETLGRGIAIIPKEGMVVAPFDGVVEAIFPTKHAIGLTSTSGIQVLIHIGLDTVNLGGNYFTAFVENGSQVKAGDTLLTFDIEKIKAEGYDLTTPVIVTNSDDYIDVVAKEVTDIHQQDALLIVM